MRSLAGLEKWHSSMVHVATESLQPHWQAMRAPTRRTSTLGFSEAVCASAATAIGRARVDYFSTVACFFVIAHDLVRAYCILTLLGTRQMNVPPISTRPPIQIQDTSGKT